MRSVTRTFGVLMPFLLIAAYFAVMVWLFVSDLQQDRERSASHKQAEELRVSVQAKQETIDELTVRVDRLLVNVQRLEDAIADRDKKIAELRKSVADAEATAEKAEAALQKAKAVKTLTGFQVTWYNVTGTTASGTQTTDGLTLSVDPSVIPLGSVVELVFPDGTVLKRRAEDTGRVVKGKILDVYSSSSSSELRKRGRTYNVTVRIIGKEVL